MAFVIVIVIVIVIVLPITTLVYLSAMLNLIVSL